MKKHKIIGVFGEEDLKQNNNGNLTSINLIKGDKWLNFGIEDVYKTLKGIGIQPSELGADLLILASLVYAADTRISRASESQDRWSREIELIAPVVSPDSWKKTIPLLERMLHFLTGDFWTISFRGRPEKFQVLSKPVSQNLLNPQFNSLGLFSGGLDSLIDAINALESGKKALLVSHSGDKQASAAQKKLIQKLKQNYGTNQLEHLRLSLTFPANLIPGIDGEISTRSRSFLFIAFGAFIGSCLEVRTELRIPENGFIALNVPLDRLRLGSLSTKTTHPFYLQCWNELFSLLDFDLMVANPYWNKTKGEMVETCNNVELLRNIVLDSVSCSSIAKARWKGKTPEHCGYCLPCIIRKAALARGLGVTDPTPYTVSSLASKTFDSNSSEGEHIRSFQYAIDKIKRRPQTAQFMIHKPGPLSTMNNLEELASVYRKGLDEISLLLKNTKTAPLS